MLDSTGDGHPNSNTYEEMAAAEDARAGGSGHAEREASTREAQAEMERVQNQMSGRKSEGSERVIWRRNYIVACYYLGQ